PETCYAAGGYSLSNLTSSNVSIGSRHFPTLRLDASAEGYEEHIVYWTRVGREMPPSWAEQRWSIAKQNLQGLIPDAILVRVSMRSTDAAGSYAFLDKFVQAMIASVEPRHRSVFIACRNLRSPGPRPRNPKVGGTC
ncbi:MAG: exosortase C-terminal domain/associated protein EpsI, partial [Sphingomicrobium sp.]